MLSTTKGIVFHQLKYSETSIIAKIYTENYGLQSYMVKGARQRKPKFGPGLFQHFSFVELVANHKEKNKIHHIREIRSHYPFSAIPFDMAKTAILVFSNELAYRSIREEEKNPILFHFLSKAIQWLDVSTEGYINFHLLFAMHLTKFLGFFPKGKYSEKYSLFNLAEGSFESAKVPCTEYLSEEESRLFSKIAEASFENIASLQLNNFSRTVMLQKILRYYRLHIPAIGELKSVEVLKEVFSPN